MTADLEQRLRQFYVERVADLPTAGPRVPIGAPAEGGSDTYVDATLTARHQRPARLRWMSAAAAAVLVAVGGVGLALTSREHTRLPPGFTAGQFGTEVVLREVDDGDNSSDTVRLEATLGGTVSITLGAAAKSRTAVSTPSGERPATETEVCIEAPNAGGRCGPVPVEPELMLGSRDPSGQAIVDGISPEVVAVRFEAGPANRYWSRPVRGIALFPLTEQATAQATATLVRSDGTTVARLQADSTSLTTTEIAAAQVSRPTTVTLPATWTVNDPPAPFNSDTTFLVVRRHGRNVATGFDGPFAAQQLPMRNDADPFHSVAWLLTVPTDRLDEVSRRIANATNGRTTTTRDNSDGTSVMLWVGRGIPAGAADGLLERATTTLPPAASITDLDIARAWDSGNNPGRVGFRDDVLSALQNDILTTVTIDGAERKLWAAADDVGAVMYRLSNIKDQESPGYGVATVEPRTTLELPKGRVLGPGLWPVPATTQTLTLSLDDGSTVTPQLVDVRPLSNAKLAIFPQSVAGRTVLSISST